MLWLLNQNIRLRDTKTATVLETAKEIAVQASEFGLNLFILLTMTIIFKCITI